MLPWFWILLAGVVASHTPIFSVVGPSAGHWYSAGSLQIGTKPLFFETSNCQLAVALSSLVWDHSPYRIRAAVLRQPAAERLAEALLRGPRAAGALPSQDTFAMSSVKVLCEKQHFPTEDCQSSSWDWWGLVRIVDIYNAWCTVLGCQSDHRQRIVRTVVLPLTHIFFEFQVSLL